MILRDIVDKAEALAAERCLRQMSGMEMRESMYNILICDDEKDIVNALKIYLNDTNYHFLEAFDGEEAVHVVETKEVHLVLMDIMMPKMDGIQAMIRIRERVTCR